MKRLLYLGYYLKRLDKKAYRKFLNHVSQSTGLSKLGLVLDSALSSLRYNISLLEFFQFHFYRLKPSERKLFAGTGYMYEYQLAMNPKAARPLLEDKRLFLKEYAQFVRHNHADLENLKEHPEKASELLVNSSGKLVLKSHDGQCGWGVEVVETTDLQYDQLIAQLEKSGNNLAEEYIVQHPALMRLSPSGLNTIRIYTQLTSHDEVELLGCRLRISVNSVVDNMAAGNIVAPINEANGLVEGPAVYSDITKPEETVHPVTGTPIVGFQVPFWHETITMIKQAALLHPECRSIGWDIAITTKGPELIEGNHDWCKLVWQLPVKKGLKPILEQHLKELKETKKHLIV